jgi:fructoselysine 6-kinase
VRRWLPGQSDGFDVATVGDNCIDRFVGATNLSRVGGNAVNVAVQLSRLGRNTAYFGAVGNDTDGARTVRVLSASGVDVGFVRTVAGMTAYTEIKLSADGDRQFIFEEFGVVRDYKPDYRDIAALCTARHVHIGWLNDGGALREVLSQRGVGVSRDISINAEPCNLKVAGLDIAFVSNHGSDEAVQRTAENLLTNGAKLVVVTRGEKGSIATDGKNFRAIGAIEIKALDTTGAGDAFIAGFLDARLEECSLEECLKRGREAATAACMHFGGFPQDPWSS